MPHPKGPYSDPLNLFLNYFWNFVCGNIFSEPSVKDAVVRNSGLEIKAADYEDTPVSI